MTSFVKSRTRQLVVVAMFILVVLTLALGSARSEKAATPANAPQPPDVGVIQVRSEAVPVYKEYPARTYARDLVEVRGRVDGYIERRSFDIGADVRAGQVLYVLDVRPYQAEVERARGALAQAVADLGQANANLVKAKQDVDRLAPLVEAEAAAKQDLDNAKAALEAGQAEVESRKATIEADRAALRTAELNLDTLLPQAYQAAATGKLTPKLMKDVRTETKAMRDDIRKQYQKEEMETSTYLVAVDFYNNLESSINALEKPDAKKQLSGAYSPRARNVQELVDFMTDNGLRFAPASPGSENAYQVAHDAFVRYARGAQSSSGFQVLNAPIPAPGVKKK